jgi:hypothetical protein
MLLLPLQPVDAKLHDDGVQHLLFYYKESPRIAKGDFCSATVRNIQSPINFVLINCFIEFHRSP